MNVYMLKCDFSTDENGKETILDTLRDFEHIQIMNDTWFFATELDIEEVDNEFNEVLEEVGVAMIFELLGDFTIQGLDEEAMQWIEEHLDNGAEDEEE